MANKMIAGWTGVVLRRAAEMYGLSVDGLCGDSRAREIARARQITYLAFNRLGLGPSAIGRLMRRDHSTVAHGIRQAEYLATRQEGIRDILDEICAAATARSLAA